MQEQLFEMEDRIHKNEQELKGLRFKAAYFMNREIQKTKDLENMVEQLERKVAEKDSKVEQLEKVVKDMNQMMMVDIGKQRTSTPESFEISFLRSTSEEPIREPGKIDSSFTSLETIDITQLGSSFQKQSDIINKDQLDPAYEKRIAEWRKQETTMSSLQTLDISQLGSTFQQDYESDQSIEEISGILDITSITLVENETVEELDATPPCPSPALSARERRRATKKNFKF